MIITAESAAFLCEVGSHFRALPMEQNDSHMALTLCRGLAAPVAEQVAEQVAENSSLEELKTRR